MWPTIIFLALVLLFFIYMAARTPSKLATFEILILSDHYIKDLESKLDKARLVAENDKNMSSTFLEDYIITTFVVNLHQLLDYLKKVGVLEPQLYDIRNMVLNEIIKYNPDIADYVESKVIIGDHKNISFKLVI